MLGSLRTEAQINRSPPPDGDLGGQPTISERTSKESP